MKKSKIIRITTVPQSLKSLLKGQLKYMKTYFSIIAVSSDGECFDKMVQEQEVKGIKINMSRKITPLMDLLSLLKLILLFLKEKPQIVHSHTPKAGTLGMIAAWICRVPIRMHTVAGMPLLETTGAKRVLLELVEKITYYCATNIYPNSFVLKNLIVDLNLVSLDKLKVIANGSSNGIDTNFYNPELYKKEKCGFTFIYVGRLVKDKGLNELIHVFTKLYSTDESLRLILVGEFENDLDPLFEDVQILIFNHPGIKYVGYQNDVRPFFAGANALVFPSYREGFPNVVMQAGAMGLPSIVTDINGCNEIIIKGENGIIIPPKDESALFEAMKLFISDANLVDEMSKKSRYLITTRYEQIDIWNALLNEYNNLLC